MRARWVAAGLALVLAGGACATGAEEEEAAVSQASPGATSPAEGGTDETSRSPAPEDKKKKKGSRPERSRGNAGGDAKEPEAGGGGGGSGRGGREGPSPSEGEGARDEGAPDGRSPAGGGDGGSRRYGALAPSGGTYVYRQRGYEEFCAAGCDRQELPPRQSIETTVAQRSGSSATVVTEARASRGRLARTTTNYTREAAHITQVYVRFSYSGYTFDRTYRPKPPVESLRFPLTPGEAWSGSWRGKVSGDYEAVVAGRARMSAGGRTIEAVEVRTRTRFRGDFNGRAQARLWIDPRTKAVVKTAGNLSVTSAYGRYSTAFATSLISGPGY